MEEAQDAAVVTVWSTRFAAVLAAVSHAFVVRGGIARSLALRRNQTCASFMFLLLRMIIILLVVILALLCVVSGAWFGTYLQTKLLRVQKSIASFVVRIFLCKEFSACFRASPMSQLDCCLVFLRHIYFVHIHVVLCRIMHVQLIVFHSCNCLVQGESVFCGCLNHPSFTV